MMEQRGNGRRETKKSAFFVALSKIILPHYALFVKGMRSSSRSLPSTGAEAGTGRRNMAETASFTRHLRHGIAFPSSHWSP
jgi:hypothetical protein